MASWQSKFIAFALRNRHLMRGKLKRETWDESTSIPAFRELCEKGAAKAKIPAGVEAVPVIIEGLPEGLVAEWLQPTASAPVPLVEDAVIFYSHGGGYVSGSCSDHRALVAKFVAVSGIRLLLYEYRLAPEHPFPAAMEDTLTAYRWLLSQITPATRIIIAGDSAGGGLCLATLLALKDLGLPLPAAGIALSPWTDLKLTGESHRTRAQVAIDPPGMSPVCSRYYVGGNDPGNPWISPLYGDLRGLPPLLIDVGNDEMLRDDSIMFAEKARAAGVEVTLHVVEGQVHCFPLLPDFIPESKQAMEEIGAFMHEHIQKVEEPVSAG
jgi:monoterpene epsilon-lactone hydrolase